MEPIYREQFTIGDIHLDRFDRVKPSVLLYFAQEVAVKHCTALSFGYEAMQGRHLFWAISRQKMQITRLPKAGETITVETWPMPTTKVAYPRSTVGYDENGKELFRAISLWVLMDTDTRNMITPGKSGIIVAGTLRGLELAAPHSLVPKHLGTMCRRKVGFTELDRNGHMNNTRYLDWISDLLPSSFHKEHPVKEITLCYLSEALEGEKADIAWELNDNTLSVDGYRVMENESDFHQRIFSAQVRY